MAIGVAAVHEPGGDDFDLKIRRLALAPRTTATAVAEVTVNGLLVYSILTTVSAAVVL